MDSKEPQKSAHLTMLVVWRGKTYTADLSSPLEIGLRLYDGNASANAFYAPPPAYTPLVAGDFVGSVSAGAPVNFFNIAFNPHGNGTHTECVGHISPEHYPLPDSLRQYHFLAKLVTIRPKTVSNGDHVITTQQLKAACLSEEAPALIIRTLPNTENKRHRNYSGTNPPYLEAEGVAHLVSCGVEHLLLDLPSVDREQDGGELAAHKAFWRYPHNPRRTATITEMIYVPNDINDGYYLLQLMIANFMLDASPSKPVLYALSS